MSRKNLKNNKQTKLKLEDLDLDTYELVRKKVNKKAGKREKLPDYLPRGNWSEQSQKVLKERYLLRSEDGLIKETADEMCWRVSWEIASADVLWGASKNDVKVKAEEFYHLLVSRDFLPNSPTLMNAGSGNNLQYSACFVLPVDDSLVGIFDAIKYQALIHQTGGGTGFSFSRLRPSGSIVKSSRGVASGPVSFMKIFDSATNEIKQGGKRRGANMGILRVDHPDIMSFIHCKNEGGITNFNISVAITDKFMQALEEGMDYELYSPYKDPGGTNGQVVGKMSASEVWNEIASSAWKTGDPGLIFIDRINEGSANPVPSLGPIESTNPCGEQPLYPYDSCNLGSIFLNNFISLEEGKKSVDWERLKKVIKLSTRFMDNVIEMNPYPLAEIRKTSLAIRRIGLGVGGWADMLIDLGIPYNSDEAINLGEEIMKFIQDQAIEASEELAQERGPFPLWDISIYKSKKPRRNSTVTTIAPTGSISIIANASSGIEPIFAIAYQHIVKDKGLSRTLSFINPKFIDLAQKKGFWSEEIRQKIAEIGHLRDIPSVPNDVKDVFVTAHEIHHDWHIKMQSAFQKYTDNAVSKTINMRNETTETDIKEAYLLSWKTGCKGITVFRDGCKESQVLNLGVKKEAEVQIEKDDDSISPLRERPLMVHGATYRLNTPVGTAFITINETQEGEPLELFINVGKAGSDVSAMAQALGRTISATLRFKGSISPKERAREIAFQLAGIGGRRSVGFGPNKILSLPDAIAYAFANHFKFKVNGFLNDVEDLKRSQDYGKDNGVYESKHVNGETGDVFKIDIGYQQVANKKLSEDEKQNRLFNLLPESKYIGTSGDICPTCGASSFIYQEGCGKCYSCGFSEC